MPNQTGGATEIPASVAEEIDRATKYHELLAASRDAAARWRNYETRSYALAHAIRAGIANFLGCPPQIVAFRPVLKEADDNTPYAAAGAMEISNEDGYWHFGLVAQVGFYGNLLHFMMKGTPQGTFVVKPYWKTGNAPTFEILSEKDDFSKVGQWVFDRIKDYYDVGFDRFLASADGSAKIGFLREIK
jgi:hypothetical protein